MKKKQNGVRISVHPKFYEKIERERRRFMQKHGLYRLTTTAFTGIMQDKKWIKNDKKQKRRRK